MQEVLVSKIFNYTSTPTKNVEGQFWFNPSTNVLSRFNGTTWKPITVSSDDVAVLTDGNKVSLTNYLNTQIAALAEGIDSKQDKLLYYSEVSGDNPSATISVANIKLNGSVAEGQDTIASKAYQHVQGTYNIEDTGNKYADIIGNGSSPSARSNAATVSWNGISWSKTDVRAGGTDQDNATYSLAALSEGISNKQDKLKFYSEVDKSDDTSSDSTGSEISLKTRASQYGGSKINIFASQGEYTSGKINLTSQAYYNSADGGAITLLSDGVQGDGGEITLKAKTVDENYGPGGNINIIAERTSNVLKSNILLLANSIQLDGNLKGTALNTSIPDNTDDNHILTTKAVVTELDKKQNKLEGYSEILPENGGVETIKIVTNTGDDSLTLQSRKLIFNGDISGTGISTSIPALASSVNTKIPSEKAVRTELNKKQDTLNCYRETTSGEAIISNATSFSIDGTSNGLIVENNNGGITIRGNSFKAGQGAISLTTNAWNDGSAILFDYEGQGVAVSDALLIPEIKNKQDISDSALTTNEKTIVGAINELNTQINTEIPEPITSVYTISSDSLSSIISNTTYAGVSGQILISADVENTGPILIGEGIADKTNAFPIYPDQIFPIPFSDINNFKVTGNIGNKFNYIISFRSLNNTSPAVNGGITILNENGYYKLTPSGEGETATLTITKLK